MHLKCFIAAFAIAPLTSGIAADRGAGKDSDLTAASVAALERRLGTSVDVSVDEVRVTADGFSCIDYRTVSAQVGEGRAHAVVRGDEVLLSTSGDKRFEKTWNEHCLGPRGGAAPTQ
jgi:hypothetical protein